MLTVPDYIQVSFNVRQIEDDLLSGNLTLSQFNARKYRARKANKVQLCLDMALAYELYKLSKV